MVNGSWHSPTLLSILFLPLPLTLPSPALLPCKTCKTYTFTRIPPETTVSCLYRPGHEKSNSSVSYSIYIISEILCPLFHYPLLLSHSPTPCFSLPFTLPSFLESLTLCHHTAKEEYPIYMELIWQTVRTVETFINILVTRMNRVDHSSHSKTHHEIEQNI